MVYIMINNEYGLCSFTQYLNKFTILECGLFEVYFEFIAVFNELSHKQ